MVGTPGAPGAPDRATVRKLQEQLDNNAERFSPLAALVANHLLETHTREVGVLRTGLCAVLGHGVDPGAYPGDERVLADLRELAAEARIRENEVISLGCEVEKLERALDDAARESESAARFVATMLGGGG